MTPQDRLRLMTNICANEQISAAGIEASTDPRSSMEILLELEPALAIAVAKRAEALILIHENQLAQ